MGTWDSHGHPIANRGLDPPSQVIEPASGLIVDNAVVLEGSLFALHHFYGAMHVLRLSPDLKTLGDKVVVRGPALPVRLRSEQSYLVADVGTEAFRITPDLELVERDPRGPQQKPGQMGERMGPVVWSGTAAELRSQAAGKSMGNWVAWGQVSP